MLEDDATDDGVVTTTHIKLKKDTKKRHPFEKQPFPNDEPLPRAEDGREYVQTKGGPVGQTGTLQSPGDTAWANGSKTHHGAGWALVTPTV